MSKDMKKGRERAKEVLLPLDFKLFKNFMLDLIKLREKKLFDFEILPESTSYTYTGEIQESLMQRHKIDDETFHILIETIGNILRAFVTDTEKPFLEMFEDKETINKVKKMFDLVNELPTSSEIKDRFLIIKYCKTKFLRDLDWEINIKKVQEHVSFEKNSPVFPFCVMRLFIQPSGSHRIISETSDIEPVTMELSLSDVTGLIETFSQIRDRIIIESEKLSKTGTE
jgi:hypothetical protein